MWTATAAGTESGTGNDRGLLGRGQRRPPRSPPSEKRVFHAPRRLRLASRPERRCVMRRTGRPAPPARHSARPGHGRSPALPASDRCSPENDAVSPPRPHKTRRGRTANTRHGPFLTPAGLGRRPVPSSDLSGRFEIFTDMQAYGTSRPCRDKVRHSFPRYRQQWADAAP